MIGPPSISRRVIVHLLLAQLFGFFVGWLISNGLYLAGFLSHEIATLDDFAEARARHMVLDSIVRAPDGSLRLEPSEALVSELARTPSLKFAVFEFASRAALPGSSRELAAALDGMASARPQAMWFDWATDGPKERPGVLRTQRTPLGYVRVATYGFRFRWDDLFYSLYFNERDWMPIYFLVAFTACAASAWFAVRLGLAPLTNAAEEAARIDLELALPTHSQGPDAVGSSSLHRGCQRRARTSRRRRHASAPLHRQRGP